MKQISIYGAGLAGMVAGINLARAGYEVTIHDREAGFGGSRAVHPSIHTTPLEPQSTWEYIGIDLSENFRPTDAYPSFWYNRRRLKMPAYVANSKAYNVERGPRETSIDARLYALCQAEGVGFRFETELTMAQLEAAPAGSIIATGLYREVYEMVGMPYSTTYGYLATADCPQDEVNGAIHMGGFSVDYGYTAALNGIMFALLFSRTPLEPDDLAAFNRVIRKSRGLELGQWSSFDGCFPRDNRLTWRDKVLAGTLGGMIEPFWGYGIVGALLSGKVASLMHTDPAKARRDFARFNAGFARKLARKEKMDRTPCNKQLLRLAIAKARFDCWRNPQLARAVREPMQWFR